MEQRRAGIYVRISRDREGAGLGVERQEDDCRELAQSLGWTVVEVYEDNDLSAYSGKTRPAYRRLLDDLRAGRIDAVVAWHTDRLHRRASELEEFVTACEKAHAAVRTVRAGELDLSTASGQLVARMLAAAAQHEIDHARERMRRAKAQSAAAGKYRGGPRPYGYDADGVTVRPAEAYAIRQAAELLLSGRSLRSVVRHLNDSGVPTSRSTTWKPNTLKAMLVRPRNAGLIGRTIDDVTGPAEWPAILTEDTWRAVVGLLTNPQRQTNALNPGRVRRWLGTGIYRCGRCGDTMRVARTENGTIYVCTTAKHLTRDQTRMDAYVRAVLVERLRRPDLADILPDDSQREAVQELTTEARALRVRSRQAEDDYNNGLITGRQLKAATQHMADRLEAVDAQLGALQRRRGLAAVLGSADPGSTFLASDVEAQAAVLVSLVDSVTIRPAPRGRPAGWAPGTPYFNPEFVDIEWRQA